ncbi:CcmD family protein [candidate division KSB1 bacterium]|nr:CcmD family protein [candidate division KSB1 bacterium]RQW07150.1 MAG: CcmD family protein [candidate division KSB1 bacterium]
MMGQLTFLFMAYAIIWTALFLFMLQISKKLTNLRREVKSLQEDKQG